MERRSVLKGAAGVAGILGAGGVALQMTGSARATGGGSYGSVSATTDDGEINYIAIYGQSKVTWDGFDTPATHFGIVNEARIENPNGSTVTNYQQINTTGKVALSQGSSWGGDGESLSGEGTSGTVESDVGYDNNGDKDSTQYWEVVAPNGDASDTNEGLNSYALPANPIQASQFPQVSDGSSQDYVLRLKATYTWYNENSDGSYDTVFSETFESTVDVTVKNQEEQASGTSSGTGATAG